MSTSKFLRRISVLNQGRDLSAPILRPPAPAKTQIESLPLENPDGATLSSLRTAGWEIKFQAFNVVHTNDGIKGHHFVYLERVTSITGEYHQ